MRTTGHDGARRAFLTGRLKNRKQPILPPWIRQDRFWDGCTRCGACIATCPEKIVKAGHAKFPEIDFANGGCTFCGNCAAACPEPLFNETSGIPWKALAEIGASCLMAGNILCQTCKEACETAAIVFDRAPGRLVPPAVDGERCTGCGHCLAVCPVDAIEVRAVPGDAGDV